MKLPSRATNFWPASRFRLPAKNQRAAYLKFQLKERPTLGLALVFEVDGDNIKKAAAVVGSVSVAPTQSDQANGLLTGARVAG